MGEVDFYLFDQLGGDGDELGEVSEKRGKEAGFDADSVSLIFEEEGAHPSNSRFEFIVFGVPEIEFIEVVAYREAEAYDVTDIAKVHAKPACAVNL